MSNLSITIEQLNKLTPLQIITDEAVRDKFISIHDTLWGAGTGKSAYERESVYFANILRDNDKLLKSTPFSVFTSFIDLAVCGLSLEPGARALAYLMSRNVNMGSREHAAWESRCVLTISAYGEMVLRCRAGQIRHIDNPVIVYANDEFSYGERNGSKFVNYTCNLPHTDQDIVACFVKITRNDNTTDYAVMLPEDWARLARYSWKQNARYDRNTQKWEGQANALYGVQADGTIKIDPGFLVAKCIKHAFKAYPKVRIGRGTELQTQQVEAVQEEFTDDMYGIADPSEAEATQAETFAPAQDTSAGVTIETPAETDDVF